MCQTIEGLLNSAQQKVDLWAYDEAIAFYNEATELNPEYMEAYQIHSEVKPEICNRTFYSDQK